MGLYKLKSVFLTAFLLSGCVISGEMIDDANEFADLSTAARQEWLATNNASKLPNGMKLPNGFKMTNGVTLNASLNFGNGVQASAALGVFDLRATAKLDALAGPYLNATSGSALEQWLDESPSQKQLLLRYLIECALPAGTSVRLRYRNVTSTLGSGIGNLGPGLQSGPLSTTEQERVTSCLLARTNAKGEVVYIDLVSPTYPGFSEMDATTKSTYSVREAAFFGNLFLDTPRTYAWFPGWIAARPCTLTWNCGIVEAVGQVAAELRQDIANFYAIRDAGDCFTANSAKEIAAGIYAWHLQDRYKNDRLVPYTYCNARGVRYDNVMTAFVKPKASGASCFWNSECSSQVCIGVNSDYVVGPRTCQ